MVVVVVNQLALVEVYPEATMVSMDPALWVPGISDLRPRLRRFL